MSRSNFYKLAAMFGLILMSQSICAADTDLAGLVSNMTTNITPLGSFLGLVAYVAGVGFAIAGIVQFKAHKDNPQQVPLSKPLVYLGVGAALIFLPSVIGSAGQTIFAGGTKAKDASQF